MSFVTTQPETLSAAASDFASTGSYAVTEIQNTADGSGAGRRC